MKKGSVTWKNQFGEVEDWKDPEVLSGIKKQALAIMNHALHGGTVPVSVLKTAQLVWKTISDESKGQTPQIKFSLNIIKESIERAGFGVPIESKPQAQKTLAP